mgnify:CR=1 FL=1
MYVLGFWFLMQLFEQWIANERSSSAVAYGAHIGGFLFGWAVTGTLQTARKAIAEWRARTRKTALLSMAERISAGEIPADAAQHDPDVQKMLFLRNGSVPRDPELLRGWMSSLHPDNDAGVAASVVLRSHLEGHTEALDAASTVKGADAMARLGHSSVALGCLLDSLESASDESAQHLLRGIGTILWKDMNEPEKAARCFEGAIAIRPESAAATRARRLLESLSASPR